MISASNVLILFLFSSKSHCSFKIVLKKNSVLSFVCYLSSISVFFSCSILWPVFTRLFRIIIPYIESKNQHHFIPFLSLKAHREMSEKWYFEKHCSFNQACQFLASQSTPWRSYLENLTIEDRFINNEVDFLYIKRYVKKKKLFVRHNKVAK